MKVTITKEVQVEKVLKTEEYELPTTKLYVKDYDNYYAIIPEFAYELDSKNKGVKSTTDIYQYNCIVIKNYSSCVGADSISKVVVRVKDDYGDGINTLYNMKPNHQTTSKTYDCIDIAKFLIKKEYDYQVTEEVFMEVFENSVVGLKNVVLEDE